MTFLSLSRAARGSLVAAIGVLTTAFPLLGQANYTRAEQFLTWNLLRQITGDQVAPVWYRDSTRFWYREMTPRGTEFYQVQPALGSKNLLFENARLAAALSVAADTSVDPTKLPFQTFEFDQDGRDEQHIRVRIGKRAFRCEIKAYQCAKTDTLPTRTRFVRSPDEKWDAFVSQYNLWVRPVAGGDSIQLTTDGVSRYGYGASSPSPSQIRNHQPARPQVVWSPDSRRLAVLRFDERRVESFHLISSTTERPTHYEYPYALPGDSIIPLSELYIADLETRTTRRAQIDPQSSMSFYNFGQALAPTWSRGSDRLYATWVDRGPKHVRLMEVNPQTGEAHQILADSSKTYVIGGIDLFGAGVNWRVLANGDIIWFSERDGWAHLYRYGHDGTLKNQITAGPWVVSNLVAVDETAGRLYFTARGREPNRRPDYDFLYSVALDGTGTTLLSPEEAQHVISWVPSGKYFLDVYSQVDQPPVAIIRGADGRLVRELTRADIRGLQAISWHAGEPFTVKARDGVTDLYGVIWKPSRFDSTKRYPVIDHVYPGPLISPVPKSFFPTRSAGLSYSTFGQVQALAELGFIVVEIDALGNTARSKALYTQWYGNMGDNGLPDHVAALQQLAARIPQMDLSRVGIYGHSGGGFASTDALLRYPDFYKVAVSTSGNHDNRTYYYGWGERFQGLLTRDTVAKTDNFAAAANKTLVKNLRGHLLLIHGDMDDNVHPAHTIQMVDALIKAGKPFDMFIVPDATHDLTQHPYVIKRTWDYFVTHLLGEQPPADYVIAPPPH